LGGKWVEGGSNSDIFATNSAGKAFFIQAEHLTTAKMTEVFVPLTVQATNLGQTINKLQINLSAKNTPRTETVFYIHFTNGVGTARGGF
jgi:hypothetical protein